MLDNREEYMDERIRLLNERTETLDNIITRRANKSALIEQQNIRLKEAVGGLLAVINEMKSGVQGQDAEWNDCIKAGIEALEL